MYCFFNKFFFKVEIFGNLPIFCHAHLVAIQDFVDREILFDRCGKCPMLCLFFDFKWTISAVKSTAHVMPCFMRQHSAFLCGGLAFAAINDKEIVKERDCEIVFEFNIQCSFMGCAGYVVIGDTITDPATAYDDRGLLPAGPQNRIWYMPFFSTDMWYMRRQIAKMNLLIKPKEQLPKIEKPETKPENLQKSIKNEPKAPEKAALNETRTGQLTFF